MSDDKLEMGHDSANHIPTGYEDFPKEVVQMLMKSHPIKGKDYNEEEFNHEMARIAKRKKMEENKRQGVEVKENLPPRPLRERTESQLQVELADEAAQRQQEEAYQAQVRQRQEELQRRRQQADQQRQAQEEQRPQPQQRPARRSELSAEEEAARQAKLMQEAEQQRQAERAARQAEIARQAEMARRAEHARQAEEAERMARENEMRRKEQQKAAKANGPEEENGVAWVGDDEDDLVQLVRHKQRPQRGYTADLSSVTEEVQRQEERGREKKKNNHSLFHAIQKQASVEEEDEMEEEVAPKMPKQKRSEEDFFDIQSEEDRQRVLDTFTKENQQEYDYDYDEEPRPVLKVIGFVLVAILVIAVVALAIRNVSVTAALNETTQQLESLQNVQQENEDLKLQIVSLEEQLKQGAPATTEDGETTTETTTEETTTTTEGTQGTASNTSSSASDTYTVQEGDIAWTIAEKVYGNGAQYQKILDANGLTESDYLQPGQVLKIPR